MASVPFHHMAGPAHRSEPSSGGAVGFATPDDLNTWVLHPPVFQGGFGQLEVPQVFEVAGKWHCFFCTSSTHWSQQYQRTNPEKPVAENHNLIADHPRGPWRIAPGTFLDGGAPCIRYAARMVDGPEGLVILGFANGGKDKCGGYVINPERILVGPDGLLCVAPTARAAE